jgi:Protein of unknown function (DUF4239)
VEWFVNLPDWLYGMLATVFAVLIGVGGLLVTRKWIARLHVAVSHNEIVSYYLSTVAIFYGIMLGLIAVSVWENYNGATTAVALEAGSLSALYRDVSGYPEPDRSALQAELRDYTRYEIEVAWPEHRRGILSPGGMHRLWGFQTRLQAFEPQTKGQEVLHFETLRAFDDLVQKRSLRLDTLTSHLARPLWGFVFLGAVLSFVVSWFFQLKSFSMHVWMTAIFAALLGMEIHLLVIMNHPYRGSLGVSPEAFQVVYDMLMR